MSKEIKIAISKLTPEQKAEHDKCIKDGYKDELCSKCGDVFLAHVHFVRCDNKPCPMSNGKSFLDMWIDAIEAKEAANEKEKNG